MLPTNESGAYITIENVFHDLKTRLIEIQFGISNPINIERDIKSSEILFAINKYIMGFPPEPVISEIGYSIDLIVQIQEFIVKNVDNIKTDSWINYDDIFKEIDNELTIYKSVLENFMIEFKKRELTADENIISTEKIPINITVPKFSLLLSLLCIEDNKTKIKPVFNTELTTLVSAVIKICSHPNGKSISYDSLYDKRTSEKYKVKVLEFWRDRFNSYEARCKNILSEIESGLSK